MQMRAQINALKAEIKKLQELMLEAYKKMEDPECKERLRKEITEHMQRSYRINDESDS